MRFEVLLHVESRGLNARRVPFPIMSGMIGAECEHRGEDG